MSHIRRKNTDHSLCVSQKATLYVLKQFYGRFELVKDEAGSAAGVLHHLLQLLFELLVLLDQLLALQIHNKELLSIHLIGRLLDQRRLTISSLGHLEKVKLSHIKKEAVLGLAKKGHNKALKNFNLEKPHVTSPQS